MHFYIVPKWSNGLSKEKMAIIISTFLLSFSRLNGPSIYVFMLIHLYSFLWYLILFFINADSCKVHMCMPACLGLGEDDSVSYIQPVVSKFETTKALVKS